MKRTWICPSVLACVAVFGLLRLAENGRHLEARHAASGSPTSEVLEPRMLTGEEPLRSRSSRATEAWENVSPVGIRPRLPDPDEDARAQARRYYLRDRDALRLSFLEGVSTPLTGKQLESLYELGDGVDSDALAVVVEESIVAFQTQLEVLAEEYIVMLDGACETALAHDPSEIVSEPGLLHRESGEAHRIVVQSGEERIVFRLRPDRERLQRLNRSGEELLRRRDHVMDQTLTAITGIPPSRRRTAVALALARGSGD